MLLYIPVWKEGDIMSNKYTNYVKEPTFLSPMDMHFRMLNTGNQSAEMPRLSNGERVNTINLTNDILNGRNAVYTLKRKK